MANGNNTINMGEQYFKGILAAYLGANFFNSPVDEWQIDVIKENISHFCETKIEHFFLSREEKEAQKRQMKQSLEVYIQGVKDEMRATGRMKAERVERFKELLELMEENKHVNQYE